MMKPRCNRRNGWERVFSTKISTVESVKDQGVVVICINDARSSKYQILQLHVYLRLNLLLVFLVELNY
jgi:hypothetical protein